MLSDSTVIAEDYIIRMAEQDFTRRAIVLGHLNHLWVTHVYGQLRDRIRARSLRTVTLNDVFLPGQALRQRAFRDAAIELVSGGALRWPTATSAVLRLVAAAESAAQQVY